MIRKGSHNEGSTTSGSNSLSTKETVLLYERQLRDAASRIHTEVGQPLVALKMKLEMLRSKESTKDYEEIQRLVGDIIKNIKNSISDLSSPLLYDFGLVPALQWLINNFKNTEGVDISFNGDESPFTCDKEISILLYRVIKILLSRITDQLTPEGIAVDFKTDKTRVKISILINTNNPSQKLQPFMKSLDVIIIKDWIDSIKGILSFKLLKTKKIRIVLQCPLRLS
jgi:signal transduction histidine kinase